MRYAINLFVGILIVLSVMSSSWANRERSDTSQSRREVSVTRENSVKSEGRSGRSGRVVKSQKLVEKKSGRSGRNSDVKEEVREQKKSGRSGRSTNSVSRSGKKKTGRSGRSGQTNTATEAEVAEDDEDIDIDIPTVEFKDKKSYSFEGFKLKLKYTLEDLEKRAIKQRQEEEKAKDDLYLAENTKLNESECAQQFTACMKSPSACGGGYSQCAGMTTTEVVAKQSYCKDILNQCRDNVVQDVLNLVYKEIGIKKDKAELAFASTCTTNVEQCMMKSCSSGVGHEFDLCSDQAKITDVRNSCSHVIDPCEDVNPGIFRTIKAKLLDRAQKIASAQAELKKAIEDEEKACTDMAGEVVGGKCQFVIELKNGGSVLQTKIVYAGDEVTCNKDTFGIDPIAEIDAKYKAKTDKATAVAGAIGGVAGGVVGGVIGAKASAVSSVAGMATGGGGSGDIVSQASSMLGSSGTGENNAVATTAISAATGVPPSVVDAGLKSTQKTGTTPVETTPAK